MKKIVYLNTDASLHEILEAHGYHLAGSENDCIESIMSFLKNLF